MPRDLGLRLPEYVESQSTSEHHRLYSDVAPLELAHDRRRAPRRTTQAAAY